MDEVMPGSGRTWYRDIQEALMRSSYEELGIPLDEDIAKEMDPTKDSPITPFDARKIAREIMKDDELGDDFLTAYFTKFREQNWNKGATQRENWNPLPLTNPNEKPVDVVGGVVNDDGWFTASEEPETNDYTQTTGGDLFNANPTNFMGSMK